MSRHNIVGSEAFQRAPFVYIRNVNGKRRMSGKAVALTATVGIGGLAATGLLAFALVQAAHVFF